MQNIFLLLSMIYWTIKPDQRNLDHLINFQLLILSFFKRSQPMLVSKFCKNGIKNWLMKDYISTKSTLILSKLENRMMILEVKITTQKNRINQMVFMSHHRNNTRSLFHKTQFHILMTTRDLKILGKLNKRIIIDGAYLLILIR